MKNILKIFTLIILFLTAGSNFCYAQNVGETAPNIKAKDITGKDFNLEEKRGNIIVLEWNNPTCPFVRKHYETNNIQNLQKTYTEKGVIWITINSSAEGREGFFKNDIDAKGWFEASKLFATHYIRDQFGEIGREYRATTTPQFYIINKNGEIAYSGAVDNIPSASKSDVEKAENYISKALDELLAEKEVTKKITSPYGCSVKY
ncbi:MAG: redoxin domain-containing protein [Rickettsiales bacterium]|nr:redoxin domain-containing protein [Rickettsiales bacterium]